MNRTFESEIIEIGLYHQYLDAIKPSTNSHLLPLHNNNIREEIAQPSPNGQKVISLYLQFQDFKGTRRDLLFNTKTVYQKGFVAQRFKD